MDIIILCVCAAHICWPALSLLPSLRPVIYFTVSQSSDLMRKKTALCSK